MEDIFKAYSIHNKNQFRNSNDFFINHLNVLSENNLNNLLLHYKGKDFSFLDLKKAQEKLVNSILLLDNSLSPIAIEIQRSPAYYISILAALELRRPFIPIDIRYPLELKKYIFAQTKASLLLTCLKDSQDIELQPLGSTFSSQNPLNDNDLKDIFAIFYTSGSTNVPKGVKLSYEGIENRFSWMWENFPYQTSEKQLFKANSIFIDSLWECLGGFLKGVPTFIAEEGLVQEPQDLLSECSKQAITRITVVPSYLKALLNTSYTPEEFMHKTAAIKYWIVSGEKFNKREAEHLYRLSPHAHILNLYGSTEVMGDVTYHVLTKNSFSYESIPIGKSIKNNTVLLLDEKHKIITYPHVQGKVVVSGAHVTPGYIESEKDEKTFISLTVDNVEKRFYVTGDIGIFQEDHHIVYIGRKDRTIKVNGIRVNLDVLESTMREHPLVYDVAAINEREGNVFIFLVMKIFPLPDDIEINLRNHFNTQYLGALINYQFVYKKELPKTISGKINYLALKEHYKNQTISTYNEQISTEISSLMEITKRVLATPFITLEDNLFHNGLNSLNAIQLAATIRKAFSKNIKVKQIFENPTVKNIHELLFEIQ